MAFLGFANVYALRVKLSVAIVTMTENDPCCQDWSSATQGLVLSSYFYGAIVTQVPGGVLAAKFGGKWVIGLGSLVGAVITLLTPLAAYQSLGLLLTTRIVEGFVLVGILVADFGQFRLLIVSVSRE
jgi:MFS family permease